MNSRYFQTNNYIKKKINCIHLAWTGMLLTLWLISGEKIGQLTLPWLAKWYTLGFQDATDRTSMDLFRRA